MFARPPTLSDALAPDTIARLNTSLESRYVIERELGAGGMATVFLAEDIKHKRKVALKVLKPELAAVLGAERFVQEITTTAALQHPHILPLFDSGTADGFLFYVMPFIDGETLREKLNRETQLGVDEAVRIGREVLDALEYAHQHGIVHRDVKPENILLHGGHAMVADFGIALAVSAAAGGRMTETGLSLGTPHYMSPEQATAEKEITARSDVYSLGSVLYEMLGGEPPHMGNSAQQIIMKIIAEPVKPVTVLRKAVPPNVAAAVAKSLEKLPADRFESARAFGEALVNPAYANAAYSAATGGAGMHVAVRGGRGRDAMLVLGGAAIVALVAGALAMRARPAVNVPTTRFAMSLTGSQDAGFYAGAFEAAPDGRSFVFPQQTARETQLYIRTLDDPEARPLAGTAGATGEACFSDDSKSIAFFTSGKLSRIPASGGTPVPIVTAAALGNGRGSCAWHGDVIVVGIPRGGLSRVSAAGGALEPLTTPDAKLNETAHLRPKFLADGKTVSFVANGPDGARIAFATLDGRVTRTSRLGGGLQQLEDGLAVYKTAEATLMAARFDARTLTLGNAVPVMENVFSRPGAGAGWSLSPNGTLIVVRGAAMTAIVLVGRDGSVEQLTKEARPFVNPRVSPDGGRIAVNAAPRGDRRFSDIFVYSRASQVLNPFTTGGGFSNPIWTRDGSRIAFSVTPDSGKPDIHIAWRNADGSGTSETIVGGMGPRFPFGWSADGRTLVFDEPPTASGTAMQVRAIALGDTVNRLVVDWAKVTRLPSVSPDGHWIAYASNVSGRYEIYVSPFPGPGGHWQVSTDFGDQPLWAHNGHELFYRDRNSVVVATVKTSPSFEVVARRTLFADQFSRENTGDWDVMPDDQHFVMLKPEAEGGQFVVVTNWLPELRARLGTK